ncbi:transposase-like protein [Leptothrix sp. C29]|uniref:Transposase-like protein n=1 Tax=Sphaerotilus uruguayifluvii TaxID=2735897 RepID=A0ABX2G7Q3_9BURK|nr:transposase-like protein [Leptothrix sp. C29]
MKKTNKFSPEVRERAVRLVQEHRGEYASLWAAIESIAPKIGCVPQTLLDWVKQAESDAGAGPGGGYSRGAAHQGAGTRGQRVAPSQRDPEAGQCVFRPCRIDRRLK